MTTRKSISFPEAIHATWAAEAEKQGVSLSTYVTTAVELMRTTKAQPFTLQPYQREIADRAMRGEVQIARPRPHRLGPTTSPDKCLSRVQKGTFCKACGTTHR